MALRSMSATFAAAARALIATHRNDVEIARVLIAAGADVNAKDNI